MNQRDLWALATLYFGTLAIGPSLSACYGEEPLFAPAPRETGEDPSPRPVAGPAVPAPRAGCPSVADALGETAAHGAAAVAAGREVFRRETFGNELYWSGELGLHRAILGERLGGVGPGLTLRRARELGLLIDADALSDELTTAIARGELSSTDPRVVLDLLARDAIVGLRGFFAPPATAEAPRALVAVGIQCALCHSKVDDLVASGVGRRMDGWPNEALDAGALLASAPELGPLARRLGLSKATVAAALRSWGPGRFDPIFFADGRPFLPNGASSAVLIPPLWGLDGVAQATSTGWGSLPYWARFEALVVLGGQGPFEDPRLTIPRSGASSPDRFGAHAPALAAFIVALRAPAAPTDASEREAIHRGRGIFIGRARCAECHAPPSFTDPGWGMRTPAQIGIDALRAERSPARGYRTPPLRGLWTRGKNGFYHDGRFSTLAEVIAHYDRHLRLGLDAGERSDLERYLRSL